MNKISKNTKTLCECAIMLAMSIALSFFKITPGTFGGSITPASMLPVLFVGLRHGSKWGFGTAFVFSIYQLLDGLSYFSYINGIGPYLICLIFDFVLAFTVLGITSFARPKLENSEEAKYNLNKDEKRYSVTKILIFMAIAMVLRFLCHFVSGITIWRSFDVYNNPWIYSLVYNVVYMLPEMLICLGAAGLLFSTKKSREFLLSNQ